MSELYYRAGLQAIMDERFFKRKQLVCEVTTLRRVSKIMEKFDKKLVNSYVNMVLTKEINATQKAVQETITGEIIQNLAIKEGRRQLGLFRTGALVNDFPSDRMDGPGINYCPGLKAVLKRLRAKQLDLEMNAARNLSSIMGKFNEKLTKAFVRKADLALRPPTKEIDLAHNTVLQTIAGNAMQDLAISNGEIQLMLFRKGDLVYNP